MVNEKELDTPLVQSIPYFYLDDERCRQITLRQVLSHTSGMPDMDEDEYNAWRFGPDRPWQQPCCQKFNKSTNQ